MKKFAFFLTAILLTGLLANAQINVDPTAQRSPLPPTITGGNVVTADANSIILDHFDAASNGQIYGVQKYVQSVDGLSQAIELSKPGNYVKYSRNVNLETKGTVEMWVNPSYYNKGLLNINWNNTTTSPSAGHVFHMSIDAEGKLYLSNWGYSISNAFHGVTQIPLNAWTHIAVTWDDSTKIYINGELDAVFTLLFRPAIRGQAYYYLPYWGDSTALFDEFHVSNIERTSAEIASRIGKGIQETGHQVSPGNLTYLFTTEQKSTLDSLKLIGSIDARDFKILRDSMPMLQYIDLSGVNIVAYSGTGGTVSSNENVYLADKIPDMAFYSKIGNSTLKTVILPNNLKTIGKFSFYNCNRLKSISIPPSVTNIQSAAFINCGFNSIILPNGVKIVGDYAFQSCNNLEQVFLPASLDSIGFCTFTFNSSLKSFEVDGGNPVFSSYEGVLFDKLRKTLVTYPNRKGNYYKVPEGVEVIDTAAFEGCWSLYNLDLPASLTRLCLEAFYECSNLVSIQIPASVNRIESLVFYNCKNLKMIHALPALPVDVSGSLSVFAGVDRSKCMLRLAMGSKSAYKVASRWSTFTWMAEDLYQQVTITAGNLSNTLTFANLVTHLKITGTMDARDFKTMRDNMPLLVEADLSSASIVAYSGTNGTLPYDHLYPANTTPSEAFYIREEGKMKTWFSQIVLPTSVVTIGDATFTNTGLKSITLHEGITQIQGWAFYNTQLNTLTLPASLTSIMDATFASIQGLTSFSVAPGNPYFSVVDGCLYDKTGETLLYWPNGKSNAAIIPNGTKTMQSRAFEGCDFINYIYLPPTLSTIHAPAFARAGNLWRFEVDSLNNWFSTMDGVLYDESRKKLVAYPNQKGTHFDMPIGIEEIGTYAFSGCWNLNSLSIPNSVTKISNNAFNACEKLGKIDLPSSINTIESEAFKDCRGLKSITVHLNYPIDLTSSSNVFNNVDKSTCVLRVPQGTAYNYRSAFQWGEFNFIDDVQNVTYRVQVPVGTKACYLAGDMNGWTQQLMTNEGHLFYTITLNAHLSDQYKYCSGPDWSYEELDSARNIIENRDYSPMDTVRSWRNTYQPWMPYSPWNVQSGSNYSIGKIQFVSPTEGWVASGNNSGLLHTVNGGETWDKVDPFPNDLAGNFSDPAVSMDWVSRTHGWALKTLMTDSLTENANGAVMYRTSDGGSSWSRKAFPKSAETITYTDADFVGDWQIHEIMEGNYQFPQSFFSAWSYLKLTVGTDGSCTFSDNVMSTGSYPPPTGMEAWVLPNGMIKMNDSDFDGFLNADKSTGFFTMTNDNGGRVFGVMQRKVPGAVYTTADLAGIWQMQAVAVDNPQTAMSPKNGWMYAIVSMDASGNAQLNMVNSRGEVNSANAQISITADGFVSVNGMSWHGYMSADKKAFYSTYTDNGGESFDLCVMQKQDVAKTYQTADLRGVWRVHEILVANTMLINPEGQLSNSIFTIRADGSTEMKSIDGKGNGDDNQLKLSVSTSGIVSESSGFVHGFMNSDKNTILYTRTDKNGYGFGAMQKDSTFSGDRGLQVQFADENNGWASIYNQSNAQFKFFRTTNGGTDWSAVSDHGPAGFFDFVDANNGWAVTGYPSDTTTTSVWSILHTTDGGLTWSNQFNLSTNKDDEFNALQFTDLNHGWVSGNNGLLLKTVDGGQHWTALSNTGRTAESNSKALFFLNANLGWVAVDHNNGNELSIIQTTDGGESWSVQNTNLTDGSLFSLYFWDADHGWFTGEVYDESGEYGTYSGIIGQFRNGSIQIGGRTSINEPIIYPNPVNEVFYIRSVEMGSTIEIYDLNGRSVLTMKASGDCRVNVRNLTKGMYVVRITNSSGVVTRKIVKM